MIDVLKEINEATEVLGINGTVKAAEFGVCQQ